MDDPEREESVLSQADRSYSSEGKELSIVTNDIAAMLDVLHELTKSVAITSLNCEHPAFYEGMLAMLNKKEGN